MLLWGAEKEVRKGGEPLIADTAAEIAPLLIGEDMKKKTKSVGKLMLRGDKVAGVETLLERFPVKTSDCAQRLFIQICGAAPSGIKHKDRILDG